MDKLGFKFVEALSLVYIYLLIFTFSFAYAIKVNKIFFKVVDYLGGCFKGIGGIRLIISI